MPEDRQVTAWPVPAGYKLVPIDPPAAWLRAYLAAHGWSRRPMGTTGFDLFELSLPGWDGPFELVMPSGNDALRAERHVADALRTLSGVEDRPVEAVKIAIVEHARAGMAAPTLAGAADA